MDNCVFNEYVCMIHKEWEGHSKGTPYLPHHGR